MRRILLDESVPVGLATPARRAGHAAETVAARGWAGTKDSALLRTADPLFDILVTADRNILFQQDLRDLRLAILVLPTNRWRPLAPRGDDIVASRSSPAGAVAHHGY